MEPLYDNLLEYYDELFPVDQDRLRFLSDISRKICPPNVSKNCHTKVLDVGCATGTFSLALMRRGMDVTGIDINTSMIQSACRRNPEPRTNARFFKMDMLEVGSVFASACFDMVICLGNTLVHLDSAKNIKRFLEQIKTVLRPGGAFVFQVINYERVLSEGMSRLPSIESPRARFEREYRQSDDGHIVFEATIFSSSGQPVFRDRTMLYPATPKELVDLANEAGFESVELFEDFSGETLRGDTLGVVGVAMR